MALGSNQMTTTTLVCYIPEIWGNFVIKAVESNLVMKPLMWDWTDPVKGKGDTLNIPKLSNLSSNTKSANTQVTLNSPTEGSTILTISVHDECSFLIEDIVKAFQSYNLSKLYTDKAGYAISKTADTNFNSLVSGFSQIVGASGVDIGDQDIRDGMEYLDLADAPPEDRAIVIHPTQKSALFGIEKYFRADYRGDGQSPVLVNGKFGQIYGMPVYISTNLGTSGGARLNCMMQRQAIAFAQGQEPRTQAAYILEYLGNLVVVDHIYGYVEARDTFGVWMKS